MLKSAKRIKLRGSNVLRIEDLKLAPKERAALDKLMASRDLRKLEPAEADALARKKAFVGRGDNALIVRFDLKVVRIDEKLPLDVLRRRRPPSRRRRARR